MYKHFPKSIYSQNFISSLRRLLHDSKNVNRSHILLAGVLGLEREFIRENFLQEGKKFKNEFGLSHRNSIQFAAHLALARMGEESSIDYVLRKTRENKSNEIVSKWLEKIAYIKQPKAMDFLFEYLYSDETFPPTHEGDIGYSYAARTINILKNIIAGFPELNLYYPPDDDIGTARRWVRTHRHNYKINRDVW
jgi:hypothetical protein